MAQLYSTVESANELGRKLQEGVYGPEVFSRYVELLASSFLMALILDVRLTEQTKDLVDAGWYEKGAVKISERDADQHNFAAEYVNRIRDRERK